MRILVAIDSSDPSQAVIEEVAARPWPKGANICVLNVVESGLLGNPLSLITAEAASLLEMATDAARTLADAGAKRIAIPGISTSTAVVQGHPGIDIAEYAKEWGAD